jgi:hypothetical protein
MLLYMFIDSSECPLPFQPHVERDHKLPWYQYTRLWVIGAWNYSWWIDKGADIAPKWCFRMKIT